MDTKLSCNHKSLAFDLYYNSELKPRKGTKDSAGLDLASTISCVVKPGKHVMIPLNIKWIVGFVKPGYKAYVAMDPRSGNAAKHRVTLTNSPGVIDQDYMGEWCANVLNLGDEDFVINKGDFICQVIIHIVPDIPELIQFCTGKIRGEGGFGSTDK